MWIYNKKFWESIPHRPGVRNGLTGYLAIFAMLIAQAAQAFPALNLTTGIPDLESSFIDVSYTGDSTTGLLTASGFANVLTPPGSPSGNITGGTFDISATINENALTASGTLNIGGTIAGLGFNSGTLLTGTFSSTAGNPVFGAGAGDPLEFLFDVTGGDAAGLFGTTAGVILSQSGYSGSFGGDFASAHFGGLADTFEQQVPEPGPLTLLFAGGLAWFAVRGHRVRASWERCRS